MPDTELLKAMGKFNEEMRQAGVMLTGEGLHPTSKGARIRIDGAERTVADGPFANDGQLLAGFWMLRVGSKQ